MLGLSSTDRAGHCAADRDRPDDFGQFGDESGSVLRRRECFATWLFGLFARKGSRPHYPPHDDHISYRLAEVRTNSRQSVQIDSCARDLVGLLPLKFVGSPPVVRWL
jgi:hypothetical protein